MPAAKCTPATIDKIHAGISIGLPQQDAAILAGISKASFHGWRQRARDELAWRDSGNEARAIEQPYVDYLDMLTRADYEAEQTLVQRIHEAATPHPSVTRTTKTEARRDEKGRIQYDGNGEPIMVVTLEQVVVREGEWDWKAALELLSRRFHDEWGNRTRTEITGAGGGPLELTIEERTEALVETARVHRQRCAKKSVKKPAKTKAEVDA